MITPLIVSSPAAAVVTRTSGTSQGIDVSWTEYDPDDVLGLPGNVHIGYLDAEQGRYGSYVFGNVTDFECGEGETPWGGHGVVEVVVDEGAAAVETATEDAIEAVVDSGGSLIEADLVVDAIQAELADEIPDTIEDEFEEFPACDYLQDRFLDGQGTTTVTVDTKRKIARITGTLTVTAGGHGEPSGVLAIAPGRHHDHGRRMGEVRILVQGAWPHLSLFRLAEGRPLLRRRSDRQDRGDGAHRRRRRRVVRRVHEVSLPHGRARALTGAADTPR